MLLIEEVSSINSLSSDIIFLIGNYLNLRTFLFFLSVCKRIRQLCRNSQFVPFIQSKTLDINVSFCLANIIKLRSSIYLTQSVDMYIQDGSSNSVIEISSELSIQVFTSVQSFKIATDEVLSMIIKKSHSSPHGQSIYFNEIVNSFLSRSFNSLTTLMIIDVEWYSQLQDLLPELKLKILFIKNCTSEMDSCFNLEKMLSLETLLMENTRLGTEIYLPENLKVAAISFCTIKSQHYDGTARKSAYHSYCNVVNASACESLDLL